ncbi:RICIN domain-containing protein [Kitasatospora sp. NPDC050543]|uniref:RICIN domain-containing protein n=1 Tax=Kitasatospora sp. NPDC050543 TaxID=3364054 RepID=UPI0037909F6D
MAIKTRIAAALLGAGLAVTAGVPAAGADSAFHPYGVPNVVELGNAASPHCLEIADWRTDNGAPTRQWDCTGGSNQQWSWTRIPGTGYVLRNVHSGKCLEIDGRRYDSGAPGQQWDCWNGNNQIWYPLAPNH